MLDYSERKAFVQSLKPGDKVACQTRILRTDLFSRSYGYQIHVVKKISPSRNKIITSCPDSTEWTFNKEGTCKTGGRFSAHYFHLEPITAEITESIRLDTIRLKADSRKWQLAKKFEELRTLHEKDEFFCLEFLSASDQLMALLDKHTKSEPEDA